MNWSKWTLRVSLGLGLVLLLAVGWGLRRAPDESAVLLPPLVDGGDVPPAFAEAVQAAREAVQQAPDSAAAVRQLARLYQANHHYTEALQCYELLAKTAAGLSPQDHYLLAEVALQLGDLARAQAELQRVLEAAPAYLPARVTLGLALLKSGESEQAARELEHVLTIEPQHVEATVHLARLELQRSDKATALNRLERLVAARPDATSAIALLAQLVEREGELERAASLRELSQQQPEPLAPDPWRAELDDSLYDPSLLGLRFEELALVGERERAQRLLQRLEKVEPGTPVVPTLQGAAAARARRYDEAAEHFRAALARGADPEKIAPVLVTSLLASGQTQAALALVQEHHAKRPDSVPLLVAYSEVLVQQKNRPEARQVLSRVLALQPYLVPQAFALAEILWAAGEREAAAGYLERVTQVDSKHAASRALLAEYHLGRADPAAALPWLEQALALQAADTDAGRQLVTMSVAAHVLAGQRAMAHGAGQEALVHFDRVVTLAPDEPQGHAGRAQALVQLGDHARAADALQALAELQPENPTVLLSLGDLRLQLGRVDLAVRHWSNARQLVAPSDDRLRAAIDHRLARAQSLSAHP